MSRSPPSPAQYTRWRIGTRAHNRWLSEFCAEEPARRAGIGLIHLQQNAQSYVPKQELKRPVANEIRAICNAIPLSRH